MTSEPVVQWATTALFGALSAHSLWRLATTRRPFDAANHLFHLGMNLVMVTMVWPWWARLPVLPQVAFFALGAAFFAGAAGWYGLGALGPGPTSDPRPTGHHRGARCQAVHAVMMLAMVWALGVMTRPAGHGAGGHGAGGHGAGHVAAAVPLDASTSIGGVVLAMVLVVGGALFLADLARHVRCCGSLRDRAGSDLLAGALMSFGMAAMCGAMLTG